MAIHKFLILAMLFSIVSCKSVEESTLQIEGGSENRTTDPTKIGSIPSMVGLLILHDKGEKGGNCSGTVVGEGLILTAAHCVEQVKLSEANQIAVHTTNGNQMVTKIESVDIHPSYLKVCLQLCSDMALIKLKLGPVDLATFQSNTRPAEINYSKPKEGDPVLIAGFGCDKRPGVFEDCVTTRANSFWKFQTTSIGRLSPIFNLASDAYFSTDGKLGRGAEGDSGGPVYDKDGKLIGVTANFLKTFENTYHNSLYTPAVADWLKEKVAMASPTKQSSSVIDREFVVKPNERCLFVSSVSKPWLSVGNAKCPRQKDNPDFFNMTMNVDTYRCGIPVLSDETLLTRGMKVCKITYSCLTSSHVTTNQTSC